MNLADVSETIVDGSELGTEQDPAEAGREYVSKTAPYVRRGIDSGALAGVGGGVMLLRGVRALRRGDRGRGLVRLLLGGVLVAVAISQRRSGGVDQTDVVDTSPDIEAGTTETETGTDPQASGDEASEVVDTSPDVEDAGSGPELDSDVESTDVDQTDVVETGVDEAELDDEAESDADANGSNAPEGETVEGSDAPSVDSTDESN